MWSVQCGQILVIIIVKVNYNYHKNNSQNPLGQFVLKFYNFDNFVRRKLSDPQKITFANDVTSHMTISELGFYVAERRFH